jgi:hypothetical protein
MRNLEKYPEILKYLRKHKVYCSLTSSPERLKKSQKVLRQILNSPYISKIYVNLPEKYRDTDKYNKKDIDYIQNLSQKIKIRRIKKDIGPISKILPTLTRIRDNKAIIISIDDDVYYPQTLINELIYYSVKYPKTIWGGAGFGFGDMETILKRTNWPEKRKPRFPYVDVIEGWGAIAYKKGFLDIPLVKKLLKKGKVCKLSDDLVISYVLAKNKIKRKVIMNKYFSGNEDVKPLSYGLGKGALHQGSGIGGIDEGVDANMIKYRDCLELF